MMNKEIIKRLGNVRIFVNDESESREIQKIAFSLGITWGSGDKSYIDWGWKSSICNITFRKRGEMLIMLRGTGTDCGRITINELRDFAESMKKKDTTTGDTGSPVWTPKAGDKVRCIKTAGFSLDPKNFLLLAGIRVGDVYTVDSFTNSYAGSHDGLRLVGYQSTHPLTSFEPVKEKKLTFDIETGGLNGPIRILPPPPGMGSQIVHYTDYMDYMKEKLFGSSGIPKDRFGTLEHTITSTATWEGVDSISRSVGMDPESAILRIKKNRFRSSPDNVVVPSVYKARKVNHERVEVESLPLINVPYGGKMTKRIPEVKITKHEVHAYYTI